MAEAKKIFSKLLAGSAKSVMPVGKLKFAMIRVSNFEFDALRRQPCRLRRFRLCRRHAWHEGGTRCP